MAKQQGARTVQCFHCRHRFQVSDEALSVPCPKCHKTIAVEDFVLKKTKPKLLMLAKIQTCGRIVVPKGARLVTDLIEAHEGIEVMGHLEAKRVLSGRPVMIGKKAYWKGDLQAPGLVVEDQAAIGGGWFEIPSDPLGLADLPRLPTNGRRRKKRNVDKKNE